MKTHPDAGRRRRGETEIHSEKVSVVYGRYVHLCRFPCQGLKEEKKKREAEQVRALFCKISLRLRPLFLLLGHSRSGGRNAGLKNSRRIYECPASRRASPGGAVHNATCTAGSSHKMAGLQTNKKKRCVNIDIYHAGYEIVAFFSRCFFHLTFLELGAEITDSSERLSLSDKAVRLMALVSSFFRPQINATSNTNSFSPFSAC